MLIEGIGNRQDTLGDLEILHGIRIGMLGDDRDEIVAGLLHSSMEDVPGLREGSLREEFPGRVVDAIVACSLEPRERFSAHIDRVVAAGNLAMTVKLRDVEDNLARVARLEADHRLKLARRYGDARERLAKDLPR